MPNYILSAYVVILAGLFFWSFCWGENSSPRLWLLRFLLVGMCFDNAMQSLGNWAINTNWYEPMSRLRWAFHVIGLPFLSIFTLSIMRSAGIAIARNKLFVNTIWLMIIISLLFGIWHDVVELQLQITEPLGVKKFTSVSSVLPYPTILANFVMMIMGIFVWRLSGWSWMFFAALFILLVNGVTAGRQWGFLAANFAEIIFILGLLCTDKHFRSLSAPKK